jgi:hypothetical protein
MIRNANWITELQHRASRGEVAHGAVEHEMAVVEDDQPLRSRSLFVSKASESSRRRRPMVQVILPRRLKSRCTMCRNRGPPD